MTGMIVSLLIGLTIGALGAIAFACCAFSEEIARKEEAELLLKELELAYEDQQKTSITFDRILRILRSEMIAAQRKDKVAASWNGALEAVKWDLEELMGKKHDQL